MISTTPTLSVALSILLALFSLCPIALITDMLYSLFIMFLVCPTRLYEWMKWGKGNITQQMVLKECFVTGVTKKYLTTSSAWTLFIRIDAAQTTGTDSHVSSYWLTISRFYSPSSNLTLSLDWWNQYFNRKEATKLLVGKIGEYYITTGVRMYYCLINLISM